MNTLWRKISLGLFALHALWLGTPNSLQAQNAQGLDLDRIRRATVFIMQVGGDDLNIFCVGSGTIVRYDGLILTNAHHTVTSASCPGQELIVAMSLAPDKPPVPQFRAEIAQVDAGLDLALLQINQALDGRRLSADDLPLFPFVELAPTLDVRLDQTILVSGYPDMGNSGLTFTPSTIAGVLEEPSGGVQSWFQLSANEPIPGTITGGGAFNQQSQLVGIPTSAPVRVQSDNARCLNLEDTNGDGFINRNDRCVPLGDLITVMRPASFARPLIRSASLSLSVEKVTTPSFQQTAQAAPQIERVYFSPSATNGSPTQVVGSFPSGTESLYLFFDYRNFTPETVYEVRVSVDGIPNRVLSLPPVRWSGNTNGLWYIGTSGQPIPNGTYEFRIFVDGVVAANRTINVGGGADPNQPFFSNVAFGVIDENGILRGDSFILPAQDVVTATFVHRNMQPGMQWIADWYYNDTLFDRIISSWPQGEPADGLYSDLSIQPTNGVQPGTYRVDLYIGTPDSARLTATGDFVVAGQPSGTLPIVFSDLSFFRVNSQFEAPSTVSATNYPDGAPALLMRFNWDTIATGTPWTLRWRIDGNVFYEETVPWNAPLSGDEFTVRLSAPNGLPDGTYTVDLSINGLQLQTAEVKIGIGQLEIDQFDRAGGIQLQGQIIDAATERGIANATFVLISEDFSIVDFEWRQDQIYALAVADRNGYFEIERSLEFDSPYSVYVLAEGYIPVTADGYTITPTILDEQGGSPLAMVIPLIKE